MSNKLDTTGTFSVLIGEANTYKGRLARSFLSKAFPVDPQGAIDESRSGVAVLITTNLLDKKLLVEKIGKHLEFQENRQEVAEVIRKSNADVLSKRVLCRRLSSRHMASANFVEIIERHIALAKSKLEIPDGEVGSGRIRLVIEDWNAILSSHSNIAPDSYLLPTVVAILKREQLSSMIVSTQSRSDWKKPSLDASLANDVSQLDDPQLLTWIVPFYGESRVAIASHVSSRKTGIPRVFELRPSAAERGSGDCRERAVDDELLSIDRHFELYSHLESGMPKRIPLKVRLYGGNHGSAHDAGHRVAFVDAIRRNISQVFSFEEVQGEVVSFESFSQYDDLFAFADGLDDSRLDHTLVLQVDEFWSEDRNSLLDLSRYWRQDVTATFDRPSTSTGDWEGPRRNRYVDHFGYFQPLHLDQISSGANSPPLKITEQQIVPKDSETLMHSLSRDKFFWPSKSERNANDSLRIPYLWDFGFLMLNRNHWLPFKEETVPGGTERRIGEIWDSLDTTGLTSGKPRATNDAASWREFLSACRVIGAKNGIANFDCDLSTVESISCLVLEIWGSTESTCQKSQHEFSETSREIDQLGLRFPRKEGLRGLLENCSSSLFYALAELITTCPHITASRRGISRSHVSDKSAASRQWYHTATSLCKESGADYYFLRLPGSYSIRGDWSLAIASGSRSELLGQLAIDTLTSRRMNLLRLQDGIGLPYRDIVPDAFMGEIPTALPVIDPLSKREKFLSLEQVCNLGPRDVENAPDALPDFMWGYRSNISKYDRDSFYWRRWLARMIEEAPKIWPVEKQNNKDLRSLEQIVVAKSDFDSSKFAEQHAEFTARLNLLKSALRRG
jgi:hypothetical protein